MTPPGPGRLGLLDGSADNDEVIRPARHPISGRGHGVIEGRQENVRPERAGYPALRDPRLGRFPSAVGDHSCFEKASDQLQNTSIADLIADQVNEPILVDTVKVGAQVGVQNPEVALLDFPPHLPHRHMWRSAGSISERAVGKQRFEDGIHLLHQGLLNHPVSDRGNAEISRSTPELRYRHPFHRCGPIGLLSQLLVQRLQKFVLSLLEPGDGEAVNARATLILSVSLPGFGEIGRIADLVDQRVDLSAPRTLHSSGIRWRFPGFLDAGAGSFAERTCPHFRHVTHQAFITPDAATQYGAFPLRLVFWIQPASPLDAGDPEPFVLIPFKSTSPRSDPWHRIGRNFACAYIRTYRWPASGWALRSRLLALSSASVALFQPYLAFGRYQVSLSH